MRRLGKTSIEIDRLGFGGIPIQRIDQESANNLFVNLKNLGVNFVDTAKMYSVSEEYIGIATKEMTKDFFFATKSTSRDYESMKRDIESSLALLNREYIDLYQVHNLPPTDFEKIFAQDGAYRALKEAKEQGKIKHIGLTTHSTESFAKMLELGVDVFETIQFPYNIVETQGEELFKKAHELGIGTIVMKPLAGGALEDAELAMKYVLSKEYLDVVIPGMAEMFELEQNRASADMVTKNESFEFTKEELQKIQEIKSEMGSNFCRRCGYCKPCPQGIDIPVVFLAGRYIKKYKLAQWGTARYDSANLEKDGKYRCTSCGVCKPRCPYNLDIPVMLREVYDMKNSQK